MLNPVFAAATAPAPADAAATNEIVDFSGGFENFIRPSVEANPQIFQLLTLIGVALVIFGVFKWMNLSRNGQAVGRSLTPVWGSLIPGVILVAPLFAIPMILGVLDVLVNFVLSFIPGS